jgi:hypothetical protein
METRLTELLANLKWFNYPSDKDYIKQIINGNFTISSGSIDLPLADGQYFRIVGSVFNDGVWKYPTTTLTDETFTGSVWALAVPPAVIALADEIDAYCESDAAKASPYISESFGGYSYSKGGNANGVTDNSWQAVFASRLNAWRKL